MDFADSARPPQGSAKPSAYELTAWHDLEYARARPLSRVVGSAGERVARAATALGTQVAEQMENHPKAGRVVARGQDVLSRGVRSAGSGARAAADVLPDWPGTALRAAGQTVGRVSRIGLSPDRVVALHRKRGHEVTSLYELRRLDLEQIDRVRRARRVGWSYPAAAAFSGAGSGLVVSGGQLVTAVSAGAAAAPSGGAIAGALAADVAAVLGLASRSVGQVSLMYGYDPEEPTEKVFVMSVLNVGTAGTAGAKTAAMADLSRLTQALVRGKTWEALNEAVVPRVAAQFAKAFGVRLTKRGLGKVVPAVGVLVGGALNWATVESIVDSADMAYRRRFLVEKYPELVDGPPLGVPCGSASDVPPTDDKPISVLGQLAEAGGPDLREQQRHA